MPARMLLALGLVAAVLLGVLGSGWFLWDRATALPEWYDPEAALALEAVDTEGAVPEVESTWEELGPAAPDSPGAPAPAAAEGDGARPPGAATPRRARALKNFHLRSTRDPAFRGAIRASRATFDAGQLEAGIVFDASGVAIEQLEPDSRALYERAIRTFPSLRKQQVFLGIEDEPVTRDGFLQLGPRPRVRIGELRYSLKSVARRLGVDPRRVEAEINRAMRKLKLTDPDAPPPPNSAPRGE
jgi:hypothetical protein